MRYRLVVVLSLAMMTTASARGCHMQQFYLVFGTDNQVHMDAASGQPCFVTLNARASVQSGSILQSAANGTAAMPSSHKWGYQSRAGYAGKDHFVVEMSGTSFVGRTNDIPLSGSTKIDVDVDVSP